MACCTPPRAHISHNALLEWQVWYFRWVWLRTAFKIRRRCWRNISGMLLIRSILQGAWRRGVLVTDFHVMVWLKKHRKKDKQKQEKIGEIEGVIGLAVDGVLEACVKPGALTAGFKGKGKGYGLESGLYFIFWRLNSYPPPPTPFWTSVASFFLSCLWVFQQWFTARVVCCRALTITYSVPGLTSIRKFALITMQAHWPCWYAHREMWWWCDKRSE